MERPVYLIAAVEPEWGRKTVVVQFEKESAKAMTSSTSGWMWSRLYSLTSRDCLMIPRIGKNQRESSYSVACLTIRTAAWPKSSRLRLRFAFVCSVSSGSDLDSGNVYER
jgi:hypothetical protein